MASAEPQTAPIAARYATPNEAAKYLRIDPYTLRKWIREGRLPAVRVGVRLLRVDLNDCDRLTHPVAGATDAG